MSTLDVRDLTVRLPTAGDRPDAVTGVSFAVERGEILCLVGESGSGKTVIAHSVMGLLPKTLALSAGEIRLEGEELTKASEARRRELRGARMAMIFQEPMSALNPVMTCGAQIDEVLRYHTRQSSSERRARAVALMSEVALPDPDRLLDAYPHQLSGGQRQRVGIAIAVVALWRASLTSVVIAIAIPEIPRVARLVRALVLSIREEPYVEAAVSLGTPTIKIMFGHILPNTIAPLLVQGTYVCAFAILLEAILSFLGVGLPPDIPTWGNIMAEGRVQFVAYPHNVFFPGLFLAATVLAVNILGDGLRDTLDPKLAKRVE